ncbi:MAG: GNAT family N-acetyltransferase [Oscillospiraceae bacterium]|nr:GNAT family N-acetyltransferase [Oscillospiraceae bacterium]
MIEIKKLATEQKDEIMAFDKLCFPADFWKREDWEDLLSDDRAVYYALLDEDKIIGDVFIYNWKGEKDYIKIMNIAIHPKHRGKGLAHRLLYHVTSEMEKIGMQKFCGETRASNKAMQKVFEDCGYFLNKIEENYYDNPRESAYKYVLQK